ncbi:MAG: multiheme c-type cytochrome [Rubripirellula sp.]|nr:multiheme c-type cytochrome [Rubripirellula sp.]
MNRSTLWSQRAIRWIIVAPILSALGLIPSGCSPPPPEVADTQLAIGDPDADPGRLVDAPITPPELLDLESATEEGQAGGTNGEPPTGPDAATADAETGSPTTAATTPDGANSEEIEAVFPDGQGPSSYKEWREPLAALVVTGNQHGYIEPCGCTGLDRQKGGLARRYTFMKSLEEKNWPLIAIDAGNQVRRYGRQAEIKLQQTAKALKQMDYSAVGFGPDDLRLGVGELLAVAAADDPASALFVSANVVLIDESLMPLTKIVVKNGFRIGITSVLDPESLEVTTSEEIVIKPIVEATQAAVQTLAKEGTDSRILMFYGEEEAAQDLVRAVPGFQLVVVAGGYGEPTYRAEPIEGSETKMIVTGNKGMYAGVIGFFAKEGMKYSRVALTHEFEDAPEMRKVMREYQDQLRDVGLQGLGLLPPIPNSSGQKYVGSAKCGECHTTAYDIWQGTPHFNATTDLVKPPKERSDIARHFDPECLSCHVTGWNPQDYYPYESGYLSLSSHEHLTGSGCENCHGPGSDHSAAEVKDSTVSDEVKKQLREAMVLKLENARDHCMKCHDLDNSPDFHETDAFEDVYWPEVEHYGTD